MREPQKSFKLPTRRHQPHGLTILFEDNDIIVVDKVNGLLAVSNDKVRENTAYFRLNSYVRKGNSRSRNRVFIVHRLDRETSGVMVFAKSEDAKRYLQAEWDTFTKTYYAVVNGAPPAAEGVIESYLAENNALKMYSVSDPAKGKFSRTHYRVVRTSGPRSLLEIELLTGRKNQIRAHLSERGCPVVGDTRYGNRRRDAKRLALHAATLTMRHPHSKEEMLFTAKLPACIASFETHGTH